MHGSKLAWQNGRRLRPVAEVCSVPPSVGETPGWSLRGLGGGRKLLGSDGSRWPEAVPLDEPGRVVDLPKLDQRVAELLDGVEGPHPEQVLFQGTNEALGAAVALRRPHESGRTLDAKEGEFLLEVIGHVLASVAGFTHQTALIAEPARQPRPLVWKRAPISAPMKLRRCPTLHDAQPLISDA